MLLFKVFEQESYNYNKIKENGLLEIEQPIENSDNLERCTAAASLFEHLSDFMKVLLSLHEGAQTMKLQQSWEDCWV